MMVPLTRKLICFIACCASAFAGESILKDKQGMDCHVYTPDPVDPAKTYPLLVGVHGAGGRGNGAAGLKDWAQRGDVIVIGPSFETKGERPYQNGDGIHAEKLIDLFEVLKKTYKLRDKMFLHGFSGGCQFTHRFAMLHPERVCGVSAHSGGSWATDNFGKIDIKARGIPFAISCGEKDTAFSFDGALFNRLDWYKRFQGEIDEKRFCYIGAVIPDVGHQMSGPAWDLMRQCFQLATGLPGKSATERVEISPEWKNLDGKKTDASAPSKAPRARPAISDAELDRIVQAAFKKADAEKVPDDRLVGFMKTYPPTLWKDKPGAERLFEQCKSAAAAWQKAARDKNMWNDALKKQFAEFTDGLDLSATP
ncbi:MAG: hypothetical protein RL346_1377 [Verrucomicrobiota bacterium]|jgi:predicted esterase